MTLESKVKDPFLHCYSFANINKKKMEAHLDYLEVEQSAQPKNCLHSTDTNQTGTVPTRISKKSYNYLSVTI